MEFSELTEEVFDRIQKLEPEYASTIIEYLILNTNEHDKIRLAITSDTVIQRLIINIKSDLGITDIAAPVPVPAPVLSSISISDPYLQFSSYPRAPSSRQFLPHFSNLSLQNLMQYLSLEDQFESVNPVGPDHSITHCNGFYSEQQGMVGVRSNRRCGMPVKVCHYFNKGYCKHGSKCRYFHGQITGENRNEEQQVVIRSRNLENLEMEIVELLKSRQGIPISIASLPMVYYEQYGKSLQADGYLTESQRNGKAGFSLTKLLASLNSICVLDRPHGQHSVILAEDARKYIEFSENSARQIYLTFPAESTFTEQDVSNYFNKYGPVQDVRIPCQQSRMYGFVTFVYVETAKHILSTTTTHFVCGAQVLVKPYKEKSKLSHRKHVEKPPVPLYIQNYMEGELEEPKHVPRVCDGSRLMMRRHLIDETDLQQQHSEFLLTSKTTPPFPYLGFSANKLAHSSGNGEMQEFSSTEQRLHELLDSCNEYPDDSTQGLNLPDSPFTFPSGR